MFSSWFRRRRKDTSQAINAQWLSEHLGRHREAFDVEFDGEDRLTYFGSGKRQCISFDPEARQAERTYDQYREVYANGEAKSFDSWSDNIEPMRVQFWLWAELRVLELFRLYLRNTGGGYHGGEADEDTYGTALARVETEIEERRARLPGAPGVLARFREALLRSAESDDVEFRCSFCGKTRSEVQAFISGPRVFICDECVQLTSDIVVADSEIEPDALRSVSDTDEDSKENENFPDASTMHCSFCGKSQREVRQMMAGPSVFICNECVGLCVDIVAERADTDGNS